VEQCRIASTVQPVSRPTPGVSDGYHLSVDPNQTVGDKERKARQPCDAEIAHVDWEPRRRLSDTLDDTV